MSRPRISIAELQDIPYTPARASSSFFAQHPDFKVQLDEPIAEQFNALVAHRRWKPKAMSGIYEKKWESCFGPDVPVGNYQAIDKHNPHMFLDRYLGYDWTRLPGNTFENYFYSLATREGWKRGCESEIFEKKWTLCFGRNYPIDTTPLDVSTNLLSHPFGGWCHDVHPLWEPCPEHEQHILQNPYHEDKQMPIVRAFDVRQFFDEYADFVFNPEEPVVEEFRRLAKSLQWVQGSKGREYEEAWDDLTELIRLFVAREENVESFWAASGSPFGNAKKIARSASPESVAGTERCWGYDSAVTSVDEEGSIGLELINAQSDKPALGKECGVLVEPANAESETFKAEILACLTSGEEC